MPHYMTLKTSNGEVTETRTVPGIRGADRAVNHARQLAVLWGTANGSKVVEFEVEDDEGRVVGTGVVNIIVS